MRHLLAIPLLLLAGGAGLLLETAREDAGVPASAARIPLGGFEPLAVDLLFLRAESLRAQRRLPEALAAIRLVTELQPRVSDGWEYLAHTLAWETSESAGSPEEQWPWVRESLGVLRRGLELNPDSASLRLALGLVYLNRLALRDDIAPLAERELGAPPAALAREVFRGLLDREPSEAAREGLAGSALLLAGLKEERGEVDGALELYREALPLYERFGEDPEAPEARAAAEEIRRRIAALEGG